MRIVLNYLFYFGLSLGLIQTNGLAIAAQNNKENAAQNQAKRSSKNSAKASGNEFIKMTGQAWVIEEAQPLQGLTIKGIKIIGIPEGEQEDNARIFLTLTGLLGKKIDQPDYVFYLLNNGEKEIARSQQPFGYYGVEVTHHLWREADALMVVYQVRLGKPTHVEKVAVSVEGKAKQDKAFQELLAENPLHKGEQLNHRVYEAYKAQFIALASARGYYDAEYAESVILVNPEKYQADIRLQYDAGVRYAFAGAVFGGDLALDEAFLQRFVRFKQGEPYSSEEVTRLQQDLQGSGYFSQVLVGAQPNKKDKTVPVHVQLTMNKRNRYAFGLGYSTDQGIRGKAEFDRRWVNRLGHTFSSQLNVSLKDSQFDNVYRIPSHNPTTDYYYFNLAGRFHNDAYRTGRVAFEGGYQYRQGNFDYRYAATLAWEDFRIGLDNNKILLLYPQVRWTYTSTSNRLNPQNGYQIQAEVKGAMKGVLSDVSFAQGNVSARYIYGINDRQRVLLRGDAGATWVEDFHRLPPSLRYFTGGDRTVRGYAYENIGDRDEQGANIGGKYFAVGSAEYEYFFNDNWGAATFIDVGDATIKTFKPKIGAGLGVRWRSPVGLIRVDAAHGFDKSVGDTFRLHVNVGAELDL